MHESEDKALSLCCVAKEEKKILLIVEKIIVCKSCVLEALAIEARKDLNIEGKNKGIFVAFCVGIGIGNLPGEQYCMEYYH